MFVHLTLKSELLFCSMQVGEGVVVDCLLLLLDHYTFTDTPSQEQLQHFSTVFSRPVSHPVLSEQVGAGRCERLSQVEAFG